jgi:hypothetical protein
MPKGKRESSDMTTIRVTKETASLVNDIKRMLELTLGREVTQEEVVRKAAEIAYGEKLTNIQSTLKEDKHR